MVGCYRGSVKVQLRTGAKIVNHPVKLFIPAIGPDKQLLEAGNISQTPAKYAPPLHFAAWTATITGNGLTNSNNCLNEGNSPWSLHQDSP